MQFIPIASSMGVSTLRSNTSRQSPYLQIDDPVSHPSQRHIYPSPSSPSLSSARASSSRSVTPPVNTHICSVLCMYDFHSDDPDHLPFAKNEILDVVKQGDNGWWAALRKGGRVGWIPEAFVNTLSAEVAEKLRNTREELRIYEYDAEQLYTSAPTRRIHHLSDTGEGSSSSSTSSRHDVHDNMNVCTNLLLIVGVIHFQPSPANLTSKDSCQETFAFCIGSRPLFSLNASTSSEIARRTTSILSLTLATICI
jgi:hypothetical protein